MFDAVLIANRGEIAVRIARTLRAMKVRSVAVYSDPDRGSLHVSAADAAVALGGNTAAESYLRAERVIEAALSSGAQAIIPGYGFLSENAAFAERCEAAGLVFVGPTPEQMRQFGLKHVSRDLARAAGVPMTPGTGLLAGLAEAEDSAEKVGYPVMLKSTAGGGGIGLTRCNDRAALAAAFESVRRLAGNFFGDGGVFLERYVENARHVEIQIFGDGKGRVAALGERDCSLQRRNQKVIEETPAPRLPVATRARLLEAAVRLGESVRYRSAGTVEFIYDAQRDEFYFLEVNTRLQVEHPITEAVLGVDLVEWMLRLAAGENLPLDSPPPLRGAAMEVRLYAESPLHQFQPSPGLITEAVFPQDARTDTWISAGTEVSTYYDPMLAKIIVHGKDRNEALQRLRSALERTRVSGIDTNLDYLRQIANSDFFREGRASTASLADFLYAPAVVEVLEPGTYTTVQDYPGRVGYWSVGVPPSGPMDDFAFRVANRIVGNPPSAAGLEATIQGPRLRFHRDCVVALAGAPTHARLDGKPVEAWTPLQIKSGQMLDLGRTLKGCRCYLALRGGLDVPLYLGSRATFALGQFGGHAGRTLRSADLLPLNPEPDQPDATSPLLEPRAADPALIPDYPSEWEIGALYGPHGAPDFLTEESVRAFFSAAWEVHYNSNRLGIRLNGPKPSWSRSDGGEAGLHPSNIHDTEYAIGSINLTGDMPVILTRDGPSLGGFVCPLTIAKAELWKVGQVKAGDRIRFRRMDFAEAHTLQLATDKAIEALEAPASPPPRRTPTAAGSQGCILERLPARGPRPEVAYRQAGDSYVLIEYGPNVLDLRLRFRIHALMEELKRRPIPGVLELSPGVRSLQVHYDSRRRSQVDLLEALIQAEHTLPPVESMRIPSRVVHLPMAFEDSATLDAVARYRRSVRNSAPWLPSNTEFMRRINGLDSVEQVRDILFKASYLVLGLGDVYLGAPCAVPVDPRHRLLTSKYNPARTYTAEGTVGIGGVYMCIYGMDSPGGYQLVGRTLPIWDRFLQNPGSADGKNWLLRFFDQVRFYPVSEDELIEERAAFREGRSTVRTEQATFDLATHAAFLERDAADITAFQTRQKTAFDAEVALWKADLDPADAHGTSASGDKPDDLEEPVEIHGTPVRAAVSGNVWKILVEAGQKVQSGQEIAILEAMKMEFHVCSETAGTVASLHCGAGTLVKAGDLLAVIRPDW